MILICELNLDGVKMNQHANYLGQRSLKDRVERISTFQNKVHQGIHLCLGDSEKKYKEKYLCSFK